MSIYEKKNMKINAKVTLEM